MAPPSGVNHISNPCIYGDFVSSYAERKSRFMKWLGKLFKNGSSRGSGGGGGGGGVRHPQLLGEENMVWRTPARSLDDRSRPERETEREDLDHALALSLADPGLKRPSGYRWGNNNDEELARALQDNYNSSAYPPYASSQYYPRNYRLCGGCHHDIGYGNYLGCMGQYFHPECFRCHSCGYPITETEIPTNAAGLIEYRCHPFWSQKYCPSHEHDNTARCCSCERLESWNARYYSLEDGRSLCLECMESAIMDTGDCQPLYHAIRDYYEGMNMRLEQQIPMLLVQRQALNEAIVGEKNGYHHMPETRGLCLSEEQTVSSIHRKPRIGGHRLVGMRVQPQKLTRRCEVTAILVLYGLPRLLTGAILAHELMHGWLRLKETEVLPGSTRNMASTSTASSSSSSSSISASKKGGRSNVENKLGEFFMHQIAHDASPAYGEGFRAANAAVNKYGLRRTLDHIRLTGNFPL
ncbi:Protein DA1- 2 [Turnera subulata]|uniref:Protein DA1- 2 n=1 Tax=Turnera subulata TaxID=218843 RepID=A0A9Q0FZV1_9ROSI|nr:Protein DA1- 2 [Turnera subulata]